MPKKKQATIISLARDNNSNILLQLILDLQLDFELTTSNYTTTICLNNGTRKFLLQKQSAKTFSAFQKIKSDVKGKKVPRIKEENLIYFQHDFKKEASFDKVMNIDLKSAYATILLRDGFITKETYEYLEGCNKRERLASVGMLASQKRIFYYKNGIPTDHDTIKSKTAGIFFHCVKKTYEIMSRLKMICGNKYLFTWVDGIYFAPDEEVLSNCLEELSNYSFNFKTEVLTNFEVKIFPGKAKVTFHKPSSKKDKLTDKKLFQFSINRSQFQRETISNFKLHKNTNYETSKTKISNR
jgi:hypothetical protein